jgi:hypothetical protein
MLNGVEIRADGGTEAAAAARAAPGPVVAGPSTARERAAELRRLAANAMTRARQQVGRPWISDPGLRVQVEAILALDPEDRIRMLEAEVAVLSDLRPAAG